MLGRIINTYTVIFELFINFLYINCAIQLDFYGRIINAVKTSGGLRERIFNAAYNAKRQALLHGKNIFTISYLLHGIYSYSFFS